MPYKLIVILILLISLVGCTVVPVSVNMTKEQMEPKLTTEQKKLPFHIGLVLPNSFSKVTLTSSESGPNIDYNFTFFIGDDFSETLPEFLRNRFKKVTVIKSIEKTNSFDYVFIPDISQSRLSTHLSKVTPEYFLEANLNIVINKNNQLFNSTIIKQGTENNTEVACWTCWGAEALNQQKIREEYIQLLTEVYSKLDTNLTNIFKEGK